MPVSGVKFTNFVVRFYEASSGQLTIPLQNTKFA